MTVKSIYDPSGLRFHSKKEKAHEGESAPCSFTFKCSWYFADQFIRQHEKEQLRKLKADVFDLIPSFVNVILTLYLPRSTKRRLNLCVCPGLNPNSDTSPFKFLGHAGEGARSTCQARQELDTTVGRYFSLVHSS